MASKSNRILPETADNVLCVEIGERISLSDYREIFETAAVRIFTAYPEGRLVLKYTRPFLGWDLDAAEADLKILTGQGARLSKIALVDPPERVLPKWQTLKPVLKGEIRIFAEGEYGEAAAWARQ